MVKSLKIGVTQFGDNYTNAPPAQALGARGMNRTVVGFTSFYSAENRPGDIINAVATGQIDMALAWGPLAGYFAKHSTGTARSHGAAGHRSRNWFPLCV